MELVTVIYLMVIWICNYSGIDRYITQRTF